MNELKQVETNGLTIAKVSSDQQTGNELDRAGRGINVVSSSLSLLLVFFFLEGGKGNICKNARDTDALTDLVALRKLQVELDKIWKDTGENKVEKAQSLQRNFDEAKKKIIKRELEQARIKRSGKC